MVFGAGFGFSLLHFLVFAYLLLLHFHNGKMLSKNYFGRNFSICKQMFKTFGQFVQLFGCKKIAFHWKCIRAR